MRTPRARGRLDGCHNSNLVRPGTGVPESSSRYGFRTSTRRLQARLGHHQQARNDYAASGMSKSVAGRVAIVTGVSRRTCIGYAIARDLLELGMNILIQSWSLHDAEQPWGEDARGICEVVP